MNVNTVVEILISFLETGDWRESFQRAVPLRKTRTKDNTNNEYDYKLIQTEEALLSLPIIRLTKFEFKNVLHRYCVKHQKKLSFETDEYDLKNTTLPKNERSRFVVRVLIDGKEETYELHLHMLHGELLTNVECIMTLLKPLVNDLFVQFT